MYLQLIFYSQIKSLKLGFNEIGDKGARAIAECLNNIDELDIRQCGITAVGVEAIACQLKHCNVSSGLLAFNVIRR